MEIFAGHDWLPLVFVFLMGLAVMIYVILDGYDLGVGILMSRASGKDRDVMIASIGPFWDANETWLVLSVGILLVAFPIAHGIILSALYIPTALMILGIILRGVSFDFRVRSKPKYRKLWCDVFVFGSSLAAFMQGYMLGSYILGFEFGLMPFLFCCLTGVCLLAGYSMIGASWLIIKTNGDLQKKAVKWARFSLYGTTLGMILVSLATPLMSHRIFHKWFKLPDFLFLLPIPLVTAAIILYLYFTLLKLPQPRDKGSWIPFACTVLLFILGFLGLAFSFFPYIVPDKITVWEAATSHESMILILWGVVIVLPFILGYTFYVYRIFWGKVSEADIHH